jgi:protein-L-isoaspartate(D-aspartate) O-methyltransferase
VTLVVASVSERFGSETAALQIAMVATLVERGAISTSELEGAFLAAPRHVFLPGIAPASAYVADAAIPTHFRPDGVSISSSSAPTIMAVMLERLGCRRGDRVLEVGTGTGYNAALLATLVGPTGSVTSIELDSTIAAEAAAHLDAAGVRGVRVRVGDGWLGDPTGAPFDRVIVTAGVWDVAPAWVAQLRAGGRLVVPLWLGPGLEVAVAFERGDRGLSSVSLDWCGFMRLRGDNAGPEAWVVVGDWTASVVAPTSDHVARLAALLAGPARIEPIPALSKWWFARLALSDPSAIHLVARDDWRRRAWGLFDADAASLAFVEGDSLNVYGGNEARDRLVAHIAAFGSFDLETTSIDALPIDHPGRPSALVLRRRHHQFLLHGVD